MLGLTIKLEILALIAFILQLIIHEAGHLLFGLTTGYRFLSYRIFGIIIFRDKAKLTVKLLRGNGSGAQCLMLPPDRDDYPFTLCTLGGIVLNAVASILALSINFCNLTHLTASYLIGSAIFAFIGGCFVLTNAIPNKKSGVVNDGRIFLELKKNPCARACYRRQLCLIPLLVQGQSYGEISYDLFRADADADLTNSLIGYHKLLECYHFMDLQEWFKAKDCLNGFYDNWEVLTKMLRNIVLAEDLFIHIRMGDFTVKESGVYKEIRNYLKWGSGDYNRVRVRLVYDLQFNKDKINKKKILRKLDELSKNYIYRGEAKFCEALIKEFL